MGALAKPIHYSRISYISHISPDAVIQLATASIKDVHVQNLPVIIEALAGSYPRVAIQGPSEESLEIFGNGSMQEALGDSSSSEQNLIV